MHILLWRNSLDHNLTLLCPLLTVLSFSHSYHLHIHFYLSVTAVKSADIFCLFPVRSLHLNKINGNKNQSHDSGYST